LLLAVVEFCLALDLNDLKEHKNGVAGVLINRVLVLHDVIDFLLR
jgi:hypothetical protein